MPSPDSGVSGIIRESGKQPFDEFLVTIFVGPMQLRGRKLSSIGVQSQAVILFTFEEHIREIVPHLREVELRITTVQEVTMPDGTVATTEAVNGEVLLDVGVTMPREQIDIDVQSAFQGQNLTILMGDLLLSGDKVLENINDIDFGIPPGLALFAGPQGNSDDEDDELFNELLPQAIILLGMTVVFLSGLVFFLFVARRARQNRTLSSIEATKHAETNYPNHDVPQNIASGDGVHGGTISELAAESLDGSVSDLASLYSYRDQSLLANHTLDNTPDETGSYAPSYCFSTIEVDEQSRTSGAGRSLRDTSKSNSLQPKTDPATLYGFDDNGSFASEKSNSRRPRRRTKASRPSRSGQLTSINKRTKAPSRGAKSSVKVHSLASHSFHMSGPGGNESDADTDSSQSRDVLSQVMEASETSSRDESAGSANGHQNEKANQDHQYNLMAQLDGENSDDDEESLFMGPSAAFVTRSGTVNPLRIDLGPLADPDESRRHESSELDTDDDDNLRNESTFNSLNTSVVSSGDEEEHSQKVTIV